ncbi:MAG: oligosaccharide repeat unit polymerase [Bacteroidales bacterium]|nr:oligosaccharide repeat unit polymerase [Candidatus Physcousia equi]
MHFFPLIYFSGLTYYFWQKRHVFDCAVYMSLLYAITSFCCILMVELGYLEGSGVLCDGWTPEFGIVPTLLYCGFITITIFPFSFLHPEKIERITITHRKTLYAFTFLIVVQGLLVAALVFDSIDTILSGDFRDLKDAGYAGDMSPVDIKVFSMPLPVQALYLTTNLTQLGLPLFFYYTCVEKRPLWLTWILLFTALAPILRGMLTGDRTEILNFALMFLFCLCLFRKALVRKVKIFFSIMSVPIVALGLVYVVAVSDSRFGEKDEGTSGSMLQYAGQSFANFCYFYDNHNSDLYYVERELPLSSFLLTQKQYTDTKEERTAREGFFIGVFASHVGSWMLDIGVGGAFVLCCIFALLSVLVIRYYNRKEFDIEELLLIYVLAAVPVFGIFYYRYYHIALAIIYLVAVLLYLFSKLRFVWKKDCKQEENNSEQ